MLNEGYVRHLINAVLVTGALLIVIDHWGHFTYSDIILLAIIVLVVGYRVFSRERSKGNS